LLAKLETAPVSAELGRLMSKPTRQAPARLSWVNGELSATQAREGCRGLASLLPAWTETSSTHGVDLELESTSIRWVPPQAEDYALMLQIEAADASPRSRLVMKLLEWCHDAAFFKELRQQRGLGYVAAVRYREINGWPRLGYVVQSPHTGIDELQKAVIEFIDYQAVALAAIDTKAMAHRRGSLRAIWGPPETTDEAILACWQALRVAMFDTSFQFPTDNTDSGFRLAPWENVNAALEDLTPDCVTRVAEAIACRELPWVWWAHEPLSPH
jgi:secreted Zn-dependent insulinase-like peptidase